MSLTEVNQLRKALKVAQARAEKAGLLEYEVRELRKDLQGAETRKETIGSQNREIVRLVACYSARKSDPLESRDINAVSRRSASNLRAE